MSNYDLPGGGSGDPTYSITTSGFKSWTGAGSYWTVSGTDFTLDRPGIGIIKGVEEALW